MSKNEVKCRLNKGIFQVRYNQFFLISLVCVANLATLSLDLVTFQTPLVIFCIVLTQIFNLNEVSTFLVKPTIFALFLQCTNILYIYKMLLYAINQWQH